MRASLPPEAVVVTGLGAVSGWGWSSEHLWNGLLSGRSAVRMPHGFDPTGHKTSLAAEVPAPAAGEAGPPGSHSRCDRFALVAAAEAVTAARLERCALPAASGVFFGGSTAGMAEGERYFAALAGGVERSARRTQIASHQINGPGDAVARHFGVGGPVLTLSSACASGGLALGSALAALRAGDVELAIAGGADALCQLTYAGFNALRSVDPEPCQPFRAGRLGLSLGEGAGVVVLETASSAQRRGAEALAVVRGVGASCDAHHMTAPHPQGVGAAAAMTAALEDGGATAGEVGFVSAHGTGTPLNDVAETAALQSVFGARSARLPITSVKGSIGHLLGSSGAIEAVATVQCLRADVVHPTPGEGTVDPELPVDLVLGTPRAIDRPAMALSTSFAFGGANAAVLLQGVA